MASKCSITFENNPFGVYYAGQVVSGTAELITTRPKTIRSIYISVSGFAEVRWTENITKQNTEGKPEKAIETFSASELYYSSEKYVYGQSGGNQMELPAGKYVYPFQATIPPNAPTSFNGAWGRIQHEVTVVIDRVMRYNNTFKQAYSVISPFDLNLNPDNMKPFQKIEEKTFCWGLCCGSKGPMVMKVNSPFSAYAPGQKIRFNIVLDNQSDVHCSDVKVRLVKKISYTSRSPSSKTQVTDIKVADNHCGEVVKQNKAEFNEFLQIPSTTPSSLESCGIIKVSYALKFIAKVSRIYGDLVIEIPLTIGTVPLYASSQDGPIMTQPGLGPTFKPIPPPMFEEDVRSEQFESNTFKPRYPVFLSDPNTSASGNNINNTPRNVYPSPTITPSPVAPRTPAPPATNPAAAVPTNIPSPIIASSALPSSPPYPNAMPSSSRNTAANEKNNSKVMPMTDNNFEVLGFSIPSDYEPTPSAPSAEDSGKNIGWK